MNAIEADVLLVVGDTASSEGDSLERCLSRFQFDGPKLIVAGNHDLWTHESDSYRVFTEDLPRRVRALGWQWLEEDPFISGDVGIVGTVGWYDYAFAWPALGIPRRFYEAKISPGAAERFSEFAPLFERRDDLSQHAQEIVARWNDGRYAKLGRTDEQFLEELLEKLKRHLETMSGLRGVMVATHCVPFAELLPPTGRAQWELRGRILEAHDSGN